ncbi:MAG TPA: hypothetical protein IAB87_09525 [Candidatus Coprenecus merdipullorum]|nr:hypothetical protein [Candidatus Coprenecus merdipullorum]
MKRIYTLSAVIISIAMLGACDPYYYSSWYIENRLGEDIIVMRSDSSEISNVYIPNGGTGCIFQDEGLGGFLYALEESFSNLYHSDTLVILSTSYDTLYKFHPEHHSKPYPNEEVAMNMHFWDMNNWTYSANDNEHTKSWLYILPPDSLDDSWISRPGDK